jgi:heme/copper-type cytochrome/quinol oxidase subunit 2
MQQATTGLSWPIATIIVLILVVSGGIGYGLLQQNIALEQAIQDQSRELETLKGQITSLQEKHLAEFNQLISAIKDLSNQTSKLPELLSEVEHVEGESHELQEQLTDLQEEVEHSGKEIHELQESYIKLENVANITRIYISYMDVSLNIDALREWSNRWLEQGEELARTIALERIERLERVIDSTLWPTEMRDSAIKLSANLQELKQALESGDMDFTRELLKLVSDNLHALTHSFYEEWYPSTAEVKGVHEHEEAELPILSEITIDITSKGFNGSKSFKVAVKKGQLVKILIRNMDELENNNHGFEIASFNIDILQTRPEGLAPGESMYIEFTPDKEGTFTIRCNLPCYGHGYLQNGELVVVP